MAISNSYTYWLSKSGQSRADFDREIRLREKQNAAASASHMTKLNLIRHGEGYKAYGYSSQAEMDYWARQTPNPRPVYQLVNSKTGGLLKDSKGMPGCFNPLKDAKAVDTGRVTYSNFDIQAMNAKAAVTDLAQYSSSSSASITSGAKSVLPINHILPSPTAVVSPPSSRPTITQLADVIGTSGNDSLRGAPNVSGHNLREVLKGGAGNDTYWIERSNQVIVENPSEGLDTVMLGISMMIGSSQQVYSLAPNVENIIMTSGSRSAVGNDISNTITGNSDANYIDGGGSADILTGLSGADVFKLSPAFGLTNADHITDFNSREGDTLRIGRSAFGISGSASSFSVKTVYTETDLQASLGSAEAFVYNKSSGELFFNQNGSSSGFGSGGLLAVLDNKSELPSINATA